MTESRLPQLICNKAGKLICLFSCLYLVGCASQNGKFYDGKTLPSDKVAEVSLFMESEAFAKTLHVDIDKHQLSNFREPNIGYLKPGYYEFKLTSRWWDRENKTKNAARGMTALPCAMGVHMPVPFLPLAITCPALIPDKTCKSAWNLPLEGGKKYKIDVDWAVVPPRTVVENETDQREAISISCEIQKPEQSK